jgi:VWFA-related protein
MILGQPAQQAAAQSTTQQQAIPDAPKPQVLPDLGTAPGIGTAPDSGVTSSTPDQSAPPTSLPQTPTKPSPDEGPAPQVVSGGQGPDVFLRVQTNFVEVPFTVKDKKGVLVPGLTWRDVQIYENGLRQRMALFTVDPFPLSVAMVIDQSLTFDNMAKVNNALGAVQGAFTPYDEIAIFTYNNGPRMQTDFTGGQSARLTAVLERSKGPGREPLYYDPTGPLGQTTIINGKQFDPNTSPVRNQLGIQLNVPKEIHTLNDAILAAAVALSKSKPGRRRIIYVISDGKEAGSTAKYKDVVQYLQTNKIAVFGTLVGDSSLPVVGFLDRMHLPLTMRDNILPAYANETGGFFDAEFRQKGIETSFARIAEEVRVQYTVGYYTHEPFIDGKYRSIEVKVLRPGLTVIAKKGYYPTASDVKPNTISVK